MSGYYQGIFYGIHNPHGEDVVEGMDFIFRHKDGKEICGRLEKAGIVTFQILKHPEEWHKWYTYAEIDEITDVCR